MTIEYQIYDEITNKIRNNSLQLASIPALILKVNTVLSDESKGMLDIAKVIQQEVSLATRIMRIANSPGIRRSREVTSINEAVNKLGIALIKNLAIVVSLSDKFTTKNLIHLNLMDDLIEESLESSIYGFMIAKHMTQKMSPDTALINGLVSKIGHIITLRYIDSHPEYKKLTEEEIQQTLITIGDKVGETLLVTWGFPTTCISSVFGSDLPSNNHKLNSLRDVFVLTEKYIDYRYNNSLPKTEIFEQIDMLTSEHCVECNELRRSIIS